MGWNHSEIAIESNFWYKQINFRGVIEKDVEEFKIEVESELPKDKHFREGIGTLKED
jgi:hypothetical protein